MKVVLDANIIVSFLLTGGETISSIFEYWYKNKFTVLVSDEIMKEIYQTLSKLVQKDKIEKNRRDSLIKQLRRKSKKIKVVSSVDISPDKKDNRYLACAKDGKADYLVTGDKKHLLLLEKFKYSKIISTKDFLKILKFLNYSF